MIGRTRVKLCGTTSREDALLAVAAGVDALGFIFAPKSPRFVETEQAAAIISGLPPLVDKVGVFVNEGLAEIVRKARATGLSALQLHGDESPSFCDEVRAALPHCTLFKAFRIGPQSVASEITPYREVVDAFLLDTYSKEAAGGTGKSFDWRLIDRLDLRKNYILAGGLGPENIRSALSVARPYAVDVNSGVELEPGRKDGALVRRFISEVADCDRSRRPVSGQ